MLTCEVQKYNNAVIGAQQSMRLGRAVGTRGGCWGDGRCRNIEELVRSGKHMPIKLKA